jgi:hypothetical protein
MWKSLYVKYPLFLSGFNETFIFSIHFGKSLKCQISSISVQGELSFFFMRTDMTKLQVTVACRNFANAPKSKSFLFLIKHYIIKSSQGERSYNSTHSLSQHGIEILVGGKLHTPEAPFAHIMEDWM